MPALLFVSRSSSVRMSVTSAQLLDFIIDNDSAAACAAVTAQPELLGLPCGEYHLNYPLHAAATYGRRAMIKCFLKQSTEKVDRVNELGKTSVHLILENPLDEIDPGYQLSLVNLFLKNYSSAMEMPDNDGNLPIHIAALHADEEVVGFLLSEGIASSMDVNRLGQTPLHLAIAARRHNVVLAILSVSTEECDLEDNNGRTPFFYACEVDLEMVKILYEECEDNVNSADFDEVTPLVTALRNGLTEVAAFLLEKGVELGSDVELTEVASATLERARAPKAVVSSKRDREEDSPEERALRQKS